MPYSKINKWIISGIIITLILGFMLGMAADSLVNLIQYKCWLSCRGHDAKTLTEDKILSRLARKLDLTRPQIQAIGGVLRIQSTKMNEIITESHERMKIIMENAREQIKTHLTLEQQEKYDKIIETHRSRWKRASHKTGWKKD